MSFDGQPTEFELGQMRETLAGLMPDIAAFTETSTAKNAIGGRDNKVTPVPGMEAVPCHLHPDAQRGAGETDKSGVVAADDRFRIVFPHGTDVSPGMACTVNGRVYEITSDDEGRSWALEVEVFAIRRS